MALYEKPVRVLFRDMSADLAPHEDKVFGRDAAVAWFERHYPLVKQGTVSAHLIRFSTNAPSRLHYSARAEEDLLFQVDGSRFRRYSPLRDPAAIHTKADVGAQEPIEDTSEPDGPSEFAYESDLRDFLAKILSVIEPGLRLYQDSDEGITGVEFPVGGRFVDILAVDGSGRLVVIELKVSKGYDRVVGQLLRCMSWIRLNQAEPGQQVRGIVAAREISEDLKLACSELPSVSLYEYELSVRLRRIGTDARDV